MFMVECIESRIVDSDNNNSYVAMYSTISGHPILQDVFPSVFCKENCCITDKTMVFYDKRPKKKSCTSQN